MEKLQQLYSASSAEELQFIIDSLCNKQRELLVNLLKEEKESIEPHISNNIWAYERIQLIDSILSALGVDVELFDND